MLTDTREAAHRATRAPGDDPSVALDPVPALGPVQVAAATVREGSSWWS